MEVTIQETVTICPISNPPSNQQDHILPLSYLDTDPNIAPITFRSFRVYAAKNPNQPDPFKVITSALGAALVHFYPFAGRLRQGGDGRLEVHCSPGRGVPVVRATVDRSLESFDYLDNPDEATAERLVPDPGPEEGFAHPMFLQITVFACGGYVLGSALHNALIDGMGASLLFNAVAEFARGATRLSVEPVWNRASLLGPRDPPRVEFPIQEYLRLDKAVRPYSQQVGPIVRECFFVKEEWMDRLKSYMFENSGLKFTTFEALGAFIWRAKVRASKIPSEESVKFAYLMSIRKLVKPPLPAGYWGNSCAHMYAHLLAKDLVEQPLWKTAEVVKKSKYNATDEYVRSYIDFQKLNLGQGITAGNEVSGFTDWRHLPNTTVDFGSGGPLSVFPVAKRFLGSIEPCFFLPCSSPDKFKIAVYLRESAMDGFKVEMDKLGDQEFA